MYLVVLKCMHNMFVRAYDTIVIQRSIGVVSPTQIVTHILPLP